MQHNELSESEIRILSFIENRAKTNESTTARHIHRRFDIQMESAEQILKNLVDKKFIKQFYDSEYQENRYTRKENLS